MGIALMIEGFLIDCLSLRTEFSGQLIDLFLVDDCMEALDCFDVPD